MTTKKEYSALLSKKEWKTKRLIILERDHNKCSCCGAGSRLIVHHKYYRKYPNGNMVNPWEYPNEALTTLCYHCHVKTHRITRVVVRYIPYN